MFEIFIRALLIQSVGFGFMSLLVYALHRWAYRDEFTKRQSMILALVWFGACLVVNMTAFMLAISQFPQLWQG